MKKDFCGRQLLTPSLNDSSIYWTYTHWAFLRATPAPRESQEPMNRTRSSQITLKANPSWLPGCLSHIFPRLLHWLQFTAAMTVANSAKSLKPLRRTFYGCFSMSVSLRWMSAGPTGSCWLDRVLFFNTCWYWVCNTIDFMWKQDLLVFYLSPPYPHVIRARVNYWDRHSAIPWEGMYI